MTDSLVRKNLESSLELGSLSSLAKASETIMLLVDTSGSMDATLKNGKRAIDCLRETVTEINPRANGVPIIAFGGPYDAEVRFVDIVPEPDGGTPLHLAIPMAKEYGANRVVVISDGMPDLQEQCLEEARRFGGRIDVVFVGNAGDWGSTFLDELARLTGGTRHEGDLTKGKELVGKITLLLNGDVEPTKSPIQGAGFTTVDVEEDDTDDDDDEDTDDDTEDDDDDDSDDE